MNKTTKSLIIIAILIVTTVFTTGCINKIDKEHKFIPQPIPTNASFADKLNSQMPDDKNYMFSPLSVKMALALAANGAEGETKKEILTAIGSENLEELNKTMASIIENYSKSEKLQINVANSVFVNTDNCPYDFTDAYKNAIKEYYGADSEKVNDKNAVKIINSWVEEKTNGKIKEIISHSDFWAALINAIYFKGAWEDEFYEGATAPDTFFSLDGKKSQIDFMNKTDYMSYAKSENAEIIMLPYMNSFSVIDKDGNYSEEYLKDASAAMYLIKCGTDTNIEAVLNESEFSRQRIKLSVPKFKIEYKQEISKMLSYLGIKTAFDNQKADFSGMMKLGNNDKLWIDKVLHKTYISVDEKGTEAAAVTAIMLDGATAAAPIEPIEVKFDEPFYFVIRDNTSKEILFMGRYAYAE